MHYLELTHKQYLILESYSMGVTPKKMTVNFNISNSTIQDHFNAIKTKLNCHSTNDLRFIFLSRLFSEFCYHLSKNL
ncbi:helix-turn-helix transcriptional regulator [Candidatus Enterovibrio altilux]|uniref:helix-turn-helix transcriptional regulator n=2 Tax=Candidatus Enterovibrio altilux TaxID=1927128 RepID=UPI00168160EB